jgi:Holliday junction resolvase RusA-like endonuclease
MTTSNYWFSIEPVPASRPRVPRFGKPYYVGRYAEFIKQAGSAIPAADKCHEGNLRVTIICVITKPKTTKRSNPRGDVDNYAKGILDAMTKKGYWNDDDQIVSLEIVKKFTVDHGTWRTEAGFIVTVEELGGTKL